MLPCRSQWHHLCVMNGRSQLVKHFSLPSDWVTDLWFASEAPDINEWVCILVTTTVKCFKGKQKVQARVIAKSEFNMESKDRIKDHYNKTNHQSLVRGSKWLTLSSTKDYCYIIEWVSILAVTMINEKLWHSHTQILFHNLQALQYSNLIGIWVWFL